jgi:putative peptidoglycan lipid II flippase
MLFRWGATDASGASEIGETIRWFSPAVVFYCAVKVVAPVFYARGRMRVPLVASLVAVAANVAAAVALHPSLRWNGLALAIGLGQVANLAVLLVAARRAFGPAPAAGVAVLRILGATAASAAASAVVLAVLPGGGGGALRLARGLVPVAAGMAAYAAAGRLLRSHEILVLLRAGRLDRRPRRP